MTELLIVSFAIGVVFGAGLMTLLSLVIMKVVDNEKAI